MRNWAKTKKLIVKILLQHRANLQVMTVSSVESRR